MREIQVTLRGRARGALRGLAYDYALAELRSRLNYSKKMADGPWLTVLGDGTPFKEWRANNEARRQDYKAALVSVVAELPPVPVVDLMPYHTRPGWLLWPRHKARTVAGEWADAFMESLT